MSASARNGDMPTAAATRHDALGLDPMKAHATEDLGAWSARAETTRDTGHHARIYHAKATLDWAERISRLHRTQKWWLIHGFVYTLVPSRNWDAIAQRVSVRTWRRGPCRAQESLAVDSKL